MHDNIPHGADAYWESRVDPTDTRDDPPDWLAELDLPEEIIDELAAACQEITPEMASEWARQDGEAESPDDDLAEIYGVPV